MSSEIRRSGGEYVDSGLVDGDGKPIQKWQRSKVEVKCCGEWLHCSGFTNTCGTCMSDYNMSGQQLAKRLQWGEETGESVDDILSVDCADHYDGE